MFGRRVPVESHSSFAASRLPASLDPLRNASTFTLSNWAPVACTATSVAGLCPVEPGSGTVVTSAMRECRRLLENGGSAGLSRRLREIAGSVRRVATIRSTSG